MENKNIFLTYWLVSFWLWNECPKSHQNNPKDMTENSCSVTYDGCNLSSFDPRRDKDFNVQLLNVIVKNIFSLLTVRYLINLYIFLLI